MNARTQRTTLGALLVALCLAYMMFRPVSNNVVLYPALVLLGVISVAGMASRGTRLARELVPVLILGGLVVMIGFLFGVGNPGWWHALIPWLVGPVIFWFWAASMDRGVLRIMVKTTAWATVALSAFIILYVGAQSGYLPQIIPPALLEETGAGFDGTGEATAIRLYGLSTLAAAAPMWVASLMVRRHPLLPGVALRVLAASTAVTAAMLGGRRAIILIVLLTPLIVWGLRMVMRERRPVIIPVPLAIAGVLAVPVAVIAAPSVWAMPAVQRAWDAVTGFFDPDAGVAGTNVRTDQMQHLADATADSPMVGHGFGATLNNGFSRNIERPWEFEMQYSLLLFNVGILGAILMAAAVITALAALRKAALHRPDMVPVLVVTGTAAVAMIIANASNPYLQAPGHMWAVFIALGAIGAVLNMPANDATSPAPEQDKVHRPRHGDFPALNR
ncbi:hypothetical protein ABDK96_02125 [Citricoccus nitrophenolicus]|uniref:O-antigen ligase domain-containing protein n=1 Tax=Citricoccus nitrophenolicus TaxID=863575 RepID=A0ABV0IG37_9MICC